LEPLKIEEDYKIESTPRCPECKTELTEERNFLSFNWHCVNCGYSRKSKLSFYVSQQNVMKIVRPQLEQMADDARKRKG
jgi:ribosomal protein L37AE/L43A